MIEHHGPISDVAAFNGLVATAGYDNQLILWDQETRQALARGCHDHLVNQCAFSPDGRWLVSSGSDYSARLWSVPDLRLTALLVGHDDDVEGVAFHPHARCIATTSRDHSVIVFDFKGQSLRRLRGHRADVLSVAWIDGGLSLATSSDDGTIRRWNAATGALLETIAFDGVETDTIAISEDGTIFAGNDRGEVVVIGRNGTREIVAAHSAGIKRIVHDGQTRQLATLSYDRLARFWGWDGKALRLMREASLPAVVWPRSCAFLPSGSVAFATFGTSYALFDPPSNAWSLEGVDPTPGINAICFYRKRLHSVGDAGVVRCEGRLVANVGSLCNFLIEFGDGLICGGQMGQLFNALNGKVLHQHPSPLNCAVRFVERGMPTLIVGSYTGEGLVFHLRDGQPHYHCTVRLHDNAVKGLAVHGSRLFSVCATGAAAIHETGGWEKSLDDPIGHSRIANGCAALSDGRFISVSRDRGLRIWNGGHVRSVATPHANSIKCCAVSDDGRLVATGDYGGRVALFDLQANAYKEAIRLSAAGISSLIPIAGERAFVAASYDGTLHRIEASRATSRLTA